MGLRGATVQGSGNLNSATIGKERNKVSTVNSSPPTHPPFFPVSSPAQLCSRLAVRVCSYSYESRLCSLKTANHAPWGCNQL